jgi:UDP-glucose 6-dehydrogenase
MAMEFYNGSDLNSIDSNNSISNWGTLVHNVTEEQEAIHQREYSHSFLLSSPSSSSTTITPLLSYSMKTLGIPMHPVSNIEIAEITKIAENAHRYLQIAFAEDLYLYCQANNINFPELRDALNTKWNVEILEPREGIGGHCLPKDTKMFLQSSKFKKSKILAAAMEVDEDYRRYRGL